MKFAKLASLFVFVTLAVLSLSLTSAAFAITSGSPSQTATSGSQVSFILNISPSGHSGTLFNTSLVLPNLFGSSTSWSGNSLFTILNSTDVSRTVSVQIPANQASGIYSGQIGLTGNYILPSGSSSTVPAVTNLTVTVTIPTSGNIQVVVTGSEPSQAQPFTLNNNVTLAVSSSTASGTATMSSVSPFSGITFTPAQFTLQTTSVPVKAILKGMTGLKFGDQDVTVRATSGSDSGQASFQVRKTFCSAGQSIVTNLSITGLDFSNTGEGEDTEWELLDEIEIEMDVENNNQDDEVDVVAVLGLFDSQGNDVSDELTFTGDSREDEEQIEFSIDEDDEATVSWEFKVPADLDSGDYRLAVKVYDEDATQSRDCVDTSNDLNNDYYQTISVEETNDEGRFVVVDEIELDTQLTCGQTVSGEFTVFNIGEDDEERVRITILNRELGVNVVKEITSDLDQGEDETLDFSMTVPATASSGNYVLQFITEYDYDDGSYDQEGDDPAEYSVEVIGCTQNTGNPSGGLTNIAINAELASDAKAGKELVIVATITNTGDEDSEFSISARGYSEWAELTDVSPQTISIDAGESEEVTLTMLVNDDASGTQAFDLQVSENGRVQVQEIEVELAESNVSGIFSSDNSLIWIIGLVNLVLIILIIVVAVRMSRK